MTPPRVLLIANPMASGVTPAGTARVRAAMQPLVEVDVVTTERPLHAVELARDAVRDRYAAVIAMGGDGTANEVLNGVAGGIPVGALPAGGTSVLPRALGLPRDLVAAAIAIADGVVNGRTRPLRLGLLNGRRFAFNAGVGLDAEVVRHIDRLGREKGRRPGDMRFASEVARVVVHGEYRAASATLEVPGEATERVAFLLAAKLDPWTYVGPVPLKAAPLASPEGGLELVAPRRLLRRDVPLVLLDLVVWPRHARGRDPRIVYRHDVHHARLACDVPMPAHVDGDDIGDVEEAVFGVEEQPVLLVV